mmetsp:Transcript_94051/g.166575  ORF Transcript_94051/g.166575 Transcript_94051/m.166575 type:complete len:635 (-) Transcript_94051:73-1977(-)
MVLGKSQSVPGMMGLGMQAPLPRGGGPGAGFHKKSTLNYRIDGPIDTSKHTPHSELAMSMAMQMKHSTSPAWRLEPSILAGGGLGRSGPDLGQEPAAHANMRQPRVAPAWLKHDKQVLRFYAFFQEAVSERVDENSRYRQCVITYAMEDGSVMITEPRVENSGIPQGQFLKRHRVPKADGSGFIGPGDFKIGEETVIYGRHFHITGIDRFTRWFYEENGIDLGPDEPVVEGLWEKSYKFTKTAEKGGLAVPRTVVEAKLQNAYTLGQPPPGRGLTQFLENDRKVLRFKAYWDDHTHYGSRIYVTVHFFLADNTVELNECHVRNSGRDNYPVFYKRGPLTKANRINAYPGMLEPDPEPYLPEDFVVGHSFEVWGRKFVIYDCDEFTRNFYRDYMNLDQWQGKLDVSEPPISHVELPPPPHNGVGTEEDSLINCLMVQPKPPKQDLVRLMTLSGEILRFEAKLVNGLPEDDVRRLIIGYFPADNTVAVWELQQRNSGFTGGKFCEKRRMKNPDTGRYFELSDFAVGKVVTIKSHPLHIIRADEHTLQYAEKNTDVFPFADPLFCARRLAPLREAPELQDPQGVDPDTLKDLALDAGVDIVDHEIITLLRFFGVNEAAGVPRIAGQKVLEAMSGGYA